MRAMKVRQRGRSESSLYFGVEGEKDGVGGFILSHLPTLDHNCNHGEHISVMSVNINSRSYSYFNFSLSLMSCQIMLVKLRLPTLRTQNPEFTCVGMAGVSNAQLPFTFFLLVNEHDRF